MVIIKDDFQLPTFHIKKKNLALRTVINVTESLGIGMNRTFFMPMSSSSKP